MASKYEHNRAGYEDVQAMALRYRQPECGDGEKRRIETEIFKRFRGLAHKLIQKGVQTGCDNDNLLSAAYEGIGDALKKYDPAFKKPFPSYAHGLMFDYVRTAVQKDRGAAKTAVIRHLFCNKARYQKIIDAIPDGEAPDAAYEQIAAQIMQAQTFKKENPAVVMSNIRRYFEEGVTAKTISLAAPIKGSEDLCLVDTQIDVNAPDAADIVEFRDEREMAYTVLRQALKTMPARQAEILLRRVNEESLEILSSDLNISRERVRQIQEQALKNAAKAIISAAADWRVTNVLGIDLTVMPDQEKVKMGAKALQTKLRPALQAPEHAAA